ncbi:hypothetical protein I4U23_005754 [Adineta vaga]|nr:hypothetical protein I4U23_005754 [Adineta vaga]
MNILIPLRGIGDRFSKENYRLPRPLIKIVGRPILFWVFDHIDTKNDDVIYLGLPKNLGEQFDLIEILKLEYPKHVFEVIILDFETRGAAETLFIISQSIPKNRLERKTISLDHDTIYFKSIVEQFRQLPNNLNASFYFEDIDNKPLYSYLKFDENRTYNGHFFVSDVSEKIMISSHANTGAYAFRSASVLKKFCTQLLDEAFRDSGEYYTTNLMRLMISDNEHFIGIQIHREDFVCVGTPDHLDQFLRRLKTKESPAAVRKMRFCFDFDNTLVSHPSKYGDYESVEPKIQNIQLLRELHAVGHHITIQTARRMKTHNGNVGGVIADIGRVTMETLVKLRIPYDELLFGKPCADVYIEDSAIHALIDTTKEIGWALDHAEEDFQNKKQLKGFVSPRHFHTIQQLDNLIIKSSSTDCLQGEIYFYQNIPPSIRDIFPHLDRIETNKNAGVSSIVMRKVNGITYSHLFTNLCLTKRRLLKFLSSLKRIHLSLSIESTSPNSDIYANYSDKIIARYNQYIDVYNALDAHFKSSINSSVIRSVEFLHYLLDYFIEYKGSKRGQQTPVIHGDPVFSNALLTPDSRVVFLDMRGSLADKTSLQGDLNYDLAKVYQSLTGYDFILLNKVELLSKSVVKIYLSELVDLFKDFISREYSNVPDITDIKMITAQLYFSLIPLHSTFQHQTQFYEFAIQLYQDSRLNNNPHVVQNEQQ